MLLICYPKCGTCKKTQAWLDEQGIEYEYRDIKTSNPSVEELSLWHKKSGLPIKRFWNTSGQIHKALNIKEKLPSMSLEDQLNLLASDGMLVKRPIMIDGDFVLVGFKQTEWEGWLLKR